MHRYLLYIVVILLAGCEQKAREGDAPAVTEVPPIPDFSSIADIRQKKSAFFDYMLPLVDEANARVMAERQLVERWYLDGDELSDDDKQRIHELLTKYRVNSDDPDEQKEALLRRVNVIPPSLVLAQAANESGWGTSRFAQEGNNLFGQWCFREGCGLVPEARGGSSRHEVRRFDSPLDSVESYIRNLNSHPRYRHLRDIRVKSIEDNGAVTGEELVPGLLGYSERGEEYVDEIRNMIEFNKLERFDQSTDAEQPDDTTTTGGNSAR
ncbi:glucosaminidase domain-containing protein [Thalassolituus sp. LLYu03]|uniref:glucosaminidase domain-containing protein n=1 Tax=Thalassolituus sp. LLYu03 TaxID=3421656 RepID=UPI003D27B543